jgi:molybdopterin synthase catalytic subunit
MGIDTRLTENPLRPDEELARFIAGLGGDGAVVSFTGLARPADSEGQEVTALFLDSYPGMTEASLEGIARDALGRFPVSAVSVVHRFGRIGPGEPIVFAAAAAPHRRAAFEAADYLMDRLKTDAAFWKREEGAGGPRWIEPTEADRAARARWSA